MPIASLAALLSLALIVVSVLLIAEVIADRTSHHPAVVHWRPAYNWAGHTTWNAGSIRVICGILIVAGLVLLHRRTEAGPGVPAARRPRRGWGRRH